MRLRPGSVPDLLGELAARPRPPSCMHLGEEEGRQMGKGRGGEVEREGRKGDGRGGVVQC